MTENGLPSIDVIIPHLCEQYAELQTHTQLELYRCPPEMRYLRDLPWDNSTLLDIGCGLGRVSVWLRKTWAQHSEFVMLDGDRGDACYKGIRAHDGEYYNSIASTREYCEANGLFGAVYLDAENEWEDSCPQIGIAYSFLAVGFHWPIQLYMESLERVVKPGGYCAFGTRGIEHLDNVFEQIRSARLDDVFEVDRLVVTPRHARHSVLVLRRV